MFQQWGKDINNTSPTWAYQIVGSFSESMDLIIDLSCTSLPTLSSFIGSSSNTPVSSVESAVSIASKSHTWKTWTNLYYMYLTMRIIVEVKNGGRFFWFLKLRVQCQYTLFSYVVSYNISTVCCKLVLGWPRPNATNDEANKWGDLV